MLWQTNMMLLQQADAGRAAGVVERAFTDYSYMRYVVPRAAARVRMARWFARASVSYGLRYGQVYVSSALDGVAIWLPPGQTTLTPWRLIRSGFFAAPLSVSPAGLGRFIRTNLHMEHEHARFAPGPHWYLFALAVEPARQRQGIGAALLQPVLRQSEADAMPCYLETHNETNVHFYQRHGFEVASAARQPNSDLTIYAMLRPALRHALRR
jgi:ribosomal protein S18 acetylase RimI-like enzyme